MVIPLYADIARDIAQATLWSEEDAVRVLKLSHIGVTVDRIIEAVGAEGAV